MIVQHQVPMSLYTTYRIGGLAETVYFPESAQEFCDLVASVGDASKFWILGWGANVLCQDEPLKRPVICTRSMNHSEWLSENRIVAECGVLMDELVRMTVDRGLGGLSPMSGIPGTLGGALYMNAGAYGAEISDYLVWVEIFEDGEVKRLEKEACGFGYRQAEKLRKGLILRGCWDFPAADVVELKANRVDILDRRREKQPLDFPSAGSVFKRPPGNYASKLIDEAGLRGTRVGGAGVAKKHAGFIINQGGASCQDVLELVKICQEKIKKEFGVHLEMEQRLFIELD